MELPSIKYYNQQRVNEDLNLNNFAIKIQPDRQNRNTSSLKPNQSPAKHRSVIQLDNLNYVNTQDDQKVGHSKELLIQESQSLIFQDLMSINPRDRKNLEYQESKERFEQLPMIRAKQKNSRLFFHDDENDYQQNKRRIKSNLRQNGKTLLNPNELLQQISKNSLRNNLYSKQKQLNQSSQQSMERTENAYSKNQSPRDIKSIMNRSESNQKLQIHKQKILFKVIDHAQDSHQNNLLQSKQYPSNDQVMVKKIIAITKDDIQYLSQTLKTGYQSNDILASGIKVKLQTSHNLHSSQLNMKQNDNVNQFYLNKKRLQANSVLRVRNINQDNSINKLIKLNRDFSRSQMRIEQNLSTLSSKYNDSSLDEYIGRELQTFDERESERNNLRKISFSLESQINLKGENQSISAKPTIQKELIANQPNLLMRINDQQQQKQTLRSKEKQNLKVQDNQSQDYSQSFSQNYKLPSLTLQTYENISQRMLNKRKTEESSRNLNKKYYKMLNFDSLIKDQFTDIQSKMEDLKGKQSRSIKQSHKKVKFVN